MKYARRNRLRRGVVLLIILMSFAVAQLLKQRTSEEPSKCSGLQCYDDSDCGTHCHCDRPGSALGKCIGKR